PRCSFTCSPLPARFIPWSCSSASKRSHSRFPPGPTFPPRGGPFFSYRYRGFDCRMRLVAFEREVFISEGEHVFHGGIEFHAREGPRRARELLARLLEVVQVKMGVAQREHELGRLQPGRLRDHERQQRVGG